MNKGVNTTILEGKKSLANSVNELLQQGIPPVVISMILEGLYNELEVLVNKTCEQEEQQYVEQQEKEQQQVEYVDEVQHEVAEENE